jgi:hypothetical protein
LQLAQQAEEMFIKTFSLQGYTFIREHEQRQQAQLLGLPVPQTPDIRFTPPVLVSGNPCNWIEFKNYFGFPQNPFVAQSEKRQFKRYVTYFGPGAVVYALGYQTNYPNIQGVSVFRAKEFLQGASNPITN